jgi:hypothetical protein
MVFRCLSITATRSIPNIKGKIANQENSGTVEFGVEELFFGMLIVCMLLQSLVSLTAVIFEAPGFR